MANRITKLFLFDIDGTLLRKAGPAHRIALEQAAAKLAGRPITSDGIDTGGMLDRDILRLMLSQAGVAEKKITRWMPAIVLEAQRIYPSLCPDLRHRLAPGMRAFLHRLDRARIPRGLVTGNLSRIGWHKMTRAGIRPHFTFGAFAEMGKSRTELVAIALKQALKQAPPHSQPYLIGDHLNDIRAAKENGIPIISVATGPMTREQLAPFAPDYLLDSIAHLPEEVWTTS